jgi:hypothetical protein
MAGAVAAIVQRLGEAGGDIAYYTIHPDESGASAKMANAITDVVIDGPQLILVVNDAASLAKGAGVLVESNTVTATTAESATGGVGTLPPVAPEIAEIVDGIKEAPTTQPGQFLAGGNEAKAVAGESGMAFNSYNQERGWGLLDGPSGAGGHRWNGPGPDAIPFRVEGDFELHIADNKALQREGNVSSASALTKTLGDNLDGLISHTNGSQFDSVPRIAEVRQALTDTRTALTNGEKLPDNVQLVVTNHSGQSTGVTNALSDQGVRFISEASLAHGYPRVGNP